LNTFIKFKQDFQNWYRLVKTEISYYGSFFLYSINNLTHVWLWLPENKAWQTRLFQRLYLYQSVGWVFTELPKQVVTKTYLWTNCDNIASHSCGRMPKLIPHLSENVSVLKRQALLHRCSVVQGHENSHFSWASLNQLNVVVSLCCILCEM
jgi:hypothetical protein